ncbi:MAG: hypothetical protein RL030_2492, partial [Pseudomonadota bacterium]
MPRPALILLFSACLMLAALPGAAAQDRKART